MEEIIIDDRCKKCGFYDEYGAICNLYSCHNTNYCVTDCVDKCILLRKEKECEELRKLLKTSCNHYAPGGECSLTAKNCPGTAKCIDRYREALQEIKEIVNQHRVDVRVPCNRNTEIRMKVILQKISEVEE